MRFMARPGSILTSPQDPSHGNGHAPVWGIWAALVAVYLAWGSTYLAARIAVRTAPPFLSSSVRFLIAGVLLYAWASRRGDRRGDRPTLRQWGAAAVIGGALLVGGVGMVTWAVQTVPSGIAALIVATVPLWMVIIRGSALRERVTWREVLGIAVGFAGIALLVRPSSAGRLDPAGIAAILVSTVSWASGSLYARRAPLPARPLVGTAMAMLAAGVLAALVGIAAGEVGAVRLADLSVESILAVGYLIVVGSWVGFAAYTWLLRVARTSLVSTYAYVNPVVAVFLGWAILRESVTLRTLLAGAVIVLAVALIVSGRAGSPEPSLSGEIGGPGVEPGRVEDSRRRRVLGRGRRSRRPRARPRASRPRLSGGSPPRTRESSGRSR